MPCTERCPLFIIKLVIGHFAEEAITPPEILKSEDMTLLEKKAL
jgi:hypothetical protein